MAVTIIEIIIQHENVELARATLQDGEYTIGRSRESDIFVNTPLISRKHARLTIEGESIVIEDLGSSNGTYVAELLIAGPTRISPHQAVRLGDVSLDMRRQRAASESTPTRSPRRDVIRRLLPDELLADQRHAVGKVVAQGGMGAILDAQQTATKRRVAMKVMLTTEDEGDVLRFIEEAQVTAQLEHPNIVPVHELGVDDQDQLFYTMKMVRGITLKKIITLLRQGVAGTVKKYQLPALLTVFQKACDAVAFAHSKGVIHRDIKPENIMIGDFGEVLVMDWGLAKVIGRKESRSAHQPSVVTSTRTADQEFGNTMAGTVMGTPYYMAPEQARGEVETLDGRADIYSLGVILYELLYLRYPITGDTLEAVLDNVRAGAIRWPNPRASIRQNALDHLPGGRAPDSLVAVCRKALALDPAQRYGRVEDFQADLEAYQNGFATSAEVTSPLKNLWLLIQRRKFEYAAAAIVFCAVGGLGTKAFIAGHQATRALADLKRSAPDLLRLAENDANVQDFPAAQKNIEAALAIDPTLRDGYWRRAWVLLAQEKFTASADAIRVAQKKDPKRAAFGNILPHVEKMAAATTEAERFDTGLITTVFNHLRAIGASGESAFFTRYLQLSTDQRMNLVRPRIEAWLKDGGTVTKTATGFLEVHIRPGSTSTLDGLRGLNFDVLDAGNCKLTTIEPLRNMHLAKIVMTGNPISDLSPVAGMQLFELNINGTTVSDLAPITGAPLQVMEASGSLINDLTALQKAPLEKLNASNTRIADLSPLAGAPLRELQLSGTRVTDLRPLAKAPLTILNVNGCGSLQDLGALRGRPLVRLEMTGTGVFNLDPLRGLPIKALSIDNCRKITDFFPLLDLPQLERISCSGLPQALPILRQHPTLKLITYQLPGELAAVDRPVAQFWKLFDEQAGGDRK